jgi:hypothetical protein
VALGRPIPPLTLSLHERGTLSKWAHVVSGPQSQAPRARMILACAEGKTNTQVAQEICTTKQTVGKWRRRFLVRRIAGLFDEPRPGAPRRGTTVDVCRQDGLATCVRSASITTCGDDVYHLFRG